MNKKLLSVVVFALPVIAQEQPQSRMEQLMAMDLGKIISIEVATGTPKELAEAPAVVSVITEQDIKETGARTLSEALERIPGLHVAISPYRLNTLFSIRGIQTELTPQVLVLLDGMGISQISQGSKPQAFHYPAHAIKRIEVIRGPGSAVYGADAFSGVINIITKKSADLTSEQFGATVGSFGSKEVWFNGAKSFENFNLSLLIDYETADGDKDRVTKYGSMRTDRDVQNIHFNIEGSNWAVQNWYYKVERYMGNGAGIWANDVDFDITEVFKSKFDYEVKVSESVSVNFDLLASKEDLQAYFELLPKGTWPVGTDGNLLAPPFLPVDFPNGVIGAPGWDQDTYTANINSIYQPNSYHRWRLAAGYSTIDTIAKEFKNFGPGVLDGDNYQLVSTEVISVSGTEYIYQPPYDRDLWYLSIQDEWKINDELELTAGVRYDDYSDFGSTTNPRMAVVWKTTKKLTTKLLYGTAFRAASVGETSFINNPASIGNPNIKPEKISSTELVFDYRFSDNLHGILNLYRYQAKELIIIDSTSEFKNNGRQDGQGAELEIDWQVSQKLIVNANLSLIDAEDPLTGADKPISSDFMAYTDVRYTFNDSWQLSWQNYWISNRKREIADNRPAVDDYLKSDFTIDFSSSGNWSAQLLVKNLFDEKILEPSPNSGLFGLSGLGGLLGLELPDLGYPGDFLMEGRGIYLSARYNF